MAHDIYLKAPSKTIIPPKGAVLTLFAPYAYALSKLMSEKDRTKDADTYSKEYLMDFIQKLEINVGFLNVDGSIVALSPIFEKVLRVFYDFSSILGINIRDLPYEFPKEIEDALQKNLSGESIRIPELLVRFRQHQLIWVTWESFPWLGEDGKTIGIFFFCKNITKERELETDLHRLYSRTELLTQFSLIFSHDLIQPLRQISTYVSILELELESAKNKTPNTTKTIQSLQRCIAKAKEICEGVVLYCKNGDLTVNREAVRLHEIINMTVEFCAQRSDILIKDSTPQNLILDVNKACILQLFQNLLDNAIKHSVNTPIEITISGKYIENDYYEFYIHNNGWCGDTLKQNKVFNTFYSNYVDGSGLGLTICRQIVEAYDGKIGFVSSPEEGTKINFSLPLFIDNGECDQHSYRFTEETEGGEKE